MRKRRGRLCTIELQCSLTQDRDNPNLSRVVLSQTTLALRSRLSFQMTLDQNPIEAGLGFFIKPKKDADFVGKDAVRALLGSDVTLPRKLSFLSVETPDLDPEGNETIWHGDKVQTILHSVEFFVRHGKHRNSCGLVTVGFV